MKLTKIQKRFIELDRHKETVKKFFDEYNAAVEAVVEEFQEKRGSSLIACSIKGDPTGDTFTDEEGVVYQTQLAKGRFVYFNRFEIIHTKRNGEVKGTLSKKRAETTAEEMREYNEAMAKNKKRQDTEYEGSVKIKSKKGKK